MDIIKRISKWYIPKKVLTSGPPVKCNKIPIHTHRRVKMEKADNTKYSKNIKQLKLSHIAGEGEVASTLGH